MILNPLKPEKGEIGYDGFKKIKGIKIGALTNKNGLTLSVFIPLANIHDSKLYHAIIGEVKIKLPLGAPITRPSLVNGDTAFDSREIRNYNRRGGICSNIPINSRNYQEENEKQI